MSDRLRVLLLTEGAYPYVKGGGVSTWAEMMCNRLEDRVDFLMQCYVGNPYMELQYDLPANIKSVTKVPLWGSEFPIAYYQPERMFSSIASEQEFTGAEQVEEEFLPHFESLLELLVDPYSASGAETGLLIYRLWDYFNSHSYKDTLRRESVWHTFREKLTDFYSQSAATRKVDSFNLLNATFGMRWLYHYLMPLDVDVPEVDLIHSASAGFTTIAGIVGKFRYGTPFVVSDHGVYIRERIKGINEDEGMGYYSKKLLINLSMLVTKAAYHYADVICPVASTHRDWE
ncbi:MAG: DUF3492 domain-containing protein, partial [Balneolaceae bacterium]|nr:DUF3492 domain-containing protein [Balneolaceae bacterium]